MMKELNTNIYFASFADKRLHKSLSRIKTQAQDMKIFKEIFAWNENHLEERFKKKFSYFLQPFTFYLCAWKPQVILQSFKKMENGDILLYADSGCHLNKYGVKRLLEYCDLAKKNQLPILATVFGDEMPEYMWTKADTFNYFNFTENKKITHTPQIQATTFVIVKTKETQHFLEEWLNVFKERPDLADRGKFIQPNFDGFIDHRSDQSFFSIIGKKLGIKLISADEVQGSANWETDMIDFPIWAIRDKKFSNPPTLFLLVNRISKSIKRRIRRFTSLRC